MKFSSTSRSRTMTMAIVAAVLLCCWAPRSSAFSMTRPAFFTARSATALAAGTTTVEPPTREKTRETTRTDDETTDDSVEYPDLEYLQDPSASREMDDPFHILLLGSTFDKPKITVKYVSGSLEYVLGMPMLEAKELSLFAYDEGIACLGTWPREECLQLGKQLQVRDIVCRVVPFAEGGQRGWQAKDMSSYSNWNKNRDEDYFR